MRAYYFGCGHSVGHHFWVPGTNGDLARPKENHSTIVGSIPWPNEFDGGLMPRIQNEGEAILHHKDGWTALSFADRSVDSRGMSHSTFFLEKPHMTFEEVLEFLALNFAVLMARYEFKIKLVQVATDEEST